MVTQLCTAAEWPGPFLSGNLYKAAEATVKEIRNEQHGSCLEPGYFPENQNANPALLLPT